MYIEDVHDLLDTADKINDKYETHCHIDVNNRDQVVVYIDGEILTANGTTTHAQLIDKYIDNINKGVKATDEFKDIAEVAYNEFKNYYMNAGLEEVWNMQFANLTPVEWLENYPTVAETFIEQYDNLRTKQLDDGYHRPKSQEVNDKLNIDDIGFGHIVNDCLFIDIYASECNIDKFVQKAKKQLNCQKIYLYDYYKNNDYSLQRIATKN